MKPSSRCFLQMSPIEGALEKARIMRSIGSPWLFKSFFKMSVNDFISLLGGLLGWYGKWRKSWFLFFCFCWLFWPGLGFGSDDVKTFSSADVKIGMR